MVVNFRNPQIVNEIKDKPQNVNFRNCKIQQGVIRYGIWWKSQSDIQKRDERDWIYNEETSRQWAPLA